MSAAALETIFEAAWAITNLAVVGWGGGEGRAAGQAGCLACGLAQLTGCACGAAEGFATPSLPHALCAPPFTAPLPFPLPSQGEFDTVKAVLAAAPILIAYLGGGSGLPVAEQCAWALGEREAHLPACLAALARGARPVQRVPSALPRLPSMLQPQAPAPHRRLALLKS